VSNSSIGIIKYTCDRKYSLNQTVYFMLGGSITEGTIIGWTSQVAVKEGAHKIKEDSKKYIDDTKYHISYKIHGSEHSKTIYAKDLSETKMGHAVEWFKKQGIRGEDIFQHYLEELKP